MENNWILGTWINKSDPKEEIRITEIGGDHFTLEFDKDEDDFKQSEEIIFFISNYPSGLCESKRYGRDEAASCDGKTLKINNYLFIRKT